MLIRKILLTFLALVGGLTTVSTSAQDFTISDVHYNITSAMDATEKTVEIARTSDSASSCYDGNLVLNSTVTNESTVYTITSIANNAFEGCTDLTGFTLPSTVTSISSATFKGCTGLTSVTLHDAIINIGNNAFEGCTGLTAFTFPNNNNFTSVAEAIFKGCTGLTTVTLPNSSIASIGNNAFQGCTNLATFSINKANLLAINANVFQGASISSATLKVPTAGLSAYTSAAVWSGFGMKVADTNLTDADGFLFTIAGVNYVVTNTEGATVEIALNSCYDVAGGVFAPTTISNGGTDYTITKIVASAFNRCSTLTSVTLPNSVTSIGTNAFVSCPNLASVILPNSITSILAGTFGLCAKLTNITLPNTLIGIEQGAFQDCTSLTSIDLPNTLTIIGIQAFRNSGLTSITLPSSITVIGDTAFRDCTSLMTVSINKVTPLTILMRVFQDVMLDDLTLKVPVGSVSAYEGADVWSDFGTTVEDASLPPILFTISGVNYEITSTAEATEKTVEIAASSCYDVAGGVFALTEVVNSTITYAITSIATAAFEDCTDLTAFTFPSTVTSISSSTFKGCTGLATVTLPNSIREIGNNAFENCTGLETFSINKVVPLAINANVFLNASIASATLKVPMESVSLYENAAIWSGFETTIAIAEEPVVNTESYVKENAFSIAINNGFLEITQEDRALKINRVQIINLLGQVVKTSEGESSIALSNLPVGVYIVSIYTKNGRFSRKFVRE